MLIKGNDLNDSQRRQVLAAFTHRWTYENAKRIYDGKCPACVQRSQTGGSPTVNGKPWHEYHVPLTTDAEWLATHAFYFVKDGSRLAANRRTCEVVRYLSVE